jgi:ketosteroid isomerase-like protein
MKSKIVWVLAAIVLVAAGAGKDDEGAVKEIQQAMRNLNEAFAKGQPDAIKRLTTDDHVAITPYYGGPQTRAEQLKNLADLKVPDYVPGETSVTLLTKDVALVTYPLSQKGTYKGKPVASKNYVAAVWVNKDGKWIEASYQETPLADK